MTTNTTELPDAFLIIDDQKSIANFLKQQLEHLTSAPIYVYHDYQSLQAALQNPPANFVVALCDLNLEDAPNGETVELLEQYKITTVVLSATFSERTRQRVYKHSNVADYVNKDNPAAINYAVNTLKRLRKNSTRSVWLVSHPQAQKQQETLQVLQQQRYHLQQFETLAALQNELQSKQPNFILINGLSHFKDMTNFLYEVHEQSSTPSLPIMALAEESEVALAIKLMKHGLSDFCSVNASKDELFTRINQNLLQTEAFRKIERISEEDFLTGIPNRRHFLRSAQKRMNEIHAPYFFFVAEIDIDHFKTINDKHGHPVGDQAIAFTADKIRQQFQGQTFGRIGGEEFCVLGEVEDAADAEEICETLRQTIERDSQEKFGFGFTISIGLTFVGKTLDDAIQSADQALYKSKQNGRNQTTTTLF